MAERHVVDVEQDLVLALAVPYLPAGVAGVGQDRADGALGPGDAAAVPVAARVVSGRAGDPAAGQTLGDGIDPGAGEELGEDPHDHGGGALVNGQSMQPLAVNGLSRVGMRPGVDQQIPIGRPAAEVTAFDLRLGGHGRADPHPDPVSLAFWIRHRRRS